MSAVESFSRAKRTIVAPVATTKTKPVARVTPSNETARGARLGAKSWWATFAFPAYSGLLEIV